jgi:hypothetical protein
MWDGLVAIYEEVRAQCAMPRLRQACSHGNLSGAAFWFHHMPHQASQLENHGGPPLSFCFAPPWKMP